jgi:hypothetical protein
MVELGGSKWKRGSMAGDSPCLMIGVGRLLETG